jgi:hypothetical protein
MSKPRCLRDLSPSSWSLDEQYPARLAVAEEVELFLGNRAIRVLVVFTLQAEAGLQALATATQCRSSDKGHSRFSEDTSTESQSSKYPVANATNDDNCCYGAQTGSLHDGLIR